ncbi:MAG: UDP-N-acetylmuramoyl-L-alanine--D-glutamate ligase [Johnsonella sp.]|nr:UDP-N-acetylmuramoyl-L-alanine--D-glutamate ligase [Johnsonella sp.]
MGNKVMVAGAGKSGISAAKLLLQMGGQVVLYDGNDTMCSEKILENFEEEERERITLRLGVLEAEDIRNVNICIISPGISLEEEFVGILEESGIQIWSEIQLGFQVAKGKLLAITGTNGKTTTTALLGEILKTAFEQTFVAGNIGTPYTEIALKTGDQSVTVLEVSSFQLETVIDFKPDVAAILNITPDHLNRHHTMENYISIKKEICMKQTEKDFVVLNYDDEVLREFGKSKECKAKTVFFSSTRVLEEGVYLKGEKICICKEGKEREILKTSELKILGKHNYENAMAAIAMADCLSLPVEKIRQACLDFKAVEHRIEFVMDRYGVKYFNDSKATNPDAAIQGLKAMPGSVLLIAGGYDKGSSYEEWVSHFQGKVKYLILIGQTRDAIAECAKQQGFTDIMYAESMYEAVRVCASYADMGDYVLLSPGCASWGMFENYEERGNVFKDCVKSL